MGGSQRHGSDSARRRNAAGQTNRKPGSATRGVAHGHGAAVGFDEFLGLHEHAARAAGGIEDLAAERLHDLDDQLVSIE